MMLKYAMLLLWLENTYNCIPATDKADNKVSTQRLLTKSCNKELLDWKHQWMDNIVDMLKQTGQQCSNLNYLHAAKKRQALMIWHRLHRV